MGASGPCRSPERCIELTGIETELSHKTGRRPQTPLRSFGRRKGRKLSARQEALLSEDLQRLKVPVGHPLQVVGLQKIFGTGVEEVWLEIGFGGGEHLIWQAKDHPGIGMIGAEPYLNGVVSALSAIDENKLQDRVRLHADDVHPLLDWLPSASLSRAFILFPDPWPKKRHRARRLFSAALLDKMASLLKPGAELRFASDIADYTEEARGYVSDHPLFAISKIFTSANRQAVPDWPVTRYERKASAEGREATFLICRRV
jgi:tRNA (guanine-N7-)-methyltransferase